MGLRHPLLCQISSTRQASWPSESRLGQTQSGKNRWSKSVERRHYSSSKWTDYHRWAAVFLCNNISFFLESVDHTEIVWHWFTILSLNHKYCHPMTKFDDIALRDLDHHFESQRFHSWYFWSSYMIISTYLMQLTIAIKRVLYTGYRLAYLLLILAHSRGHRSVSTASISEMVTDRENVTTAIK